MGTLNATPSRSTKRRQRTRRQLLNAAEKAVLQHGYEQASAEGIAELADLGRSTFYNHFENKWDVVLATLIDRYHEYGEKAYIPMEKTYDRAESVVRSALRLFVDVTNDPLTQQLVDRPLLLARAVAESQSKFVARDFSEGIAQGRFNIFVSQASLISSLNWSHVGMVIHAISQDSANETSLDWARLLLLQLGLEHGEIEDVVEAAQQG